MPSNCYISPCSQQANSPHQSYSTDNCFVSDKRHGELEKNRTEGRRQEASSLQPSSVGVQFVIWLHSSAFKRLCWKWKQFSMGIYEVITAVLLQIKIFCDAVLSLGQEFQTFLKTAVPPSSGRSRQRPSRSTLFLEYFTVVFTFNFISVLPFINIYSYWLGGQFCNLSSNMMYIQVRKMFQLDANNFTMILSHKWPLHVSDIYMSIFRSSYI